MTALTFEVGLCRCGCGQRTNLARANWAAAGWVKGQPLKYIKGHVRPAFGRKDRKPRRLRYDRGSLSAGWKGGTSPATGGYIRVPNARGRGRHVSEHIVIAEAALGHRLPLGAQVHHVNLVRSDNRGANLVICPSKAYHAELHRKLRVLKAGGNPWTERLCFDCSKTKPKSAFYVRPNRIDGFTSYCQECSRLSARWRGRERRERSGAA